MQHDAVQRWRKVLVGTTGVGAVIGAAWMGLSDPSTAAVSSEGATPVLAKRVMQGSNDGPCSFAPGEAMAYDIDSRTHATLDLGPLSDDVKVGGRFTTQTTAAQDREATRRWHLDLHAVARAGEGSVLAARIVDHGTEAGGETVAADETLTQTFLVHLDARCGVREFAWPTDGDLTAARRQQALVASLSFWAPPQGGARTYGAEAFDALGHYRASYRATEGGRIEGRIGSYARSFAQGDSPVAPTLTVEHSTLAVELGAGEWMTSLQAERAVGLAVAGESIGRMHGWVMAERAEPGSWRPQVQPSDGTWTWGLLLGEPTGDDAVQTATDPELVALTTGDAVERYLAMVHGRASTAQYAGFLREWLRANPSGAQELVAMLQAGAFDDEPLARSALYYALATADTPEATGALVGLVGGDDTRLAHRVSAAHALAKLPNPPAEVVDVLAQQAGRTDIHPAARGSLAMALGTFAAESDERAPALAQQARARIEGWLDEPGDEDELSGSLLAAGNAGHDDLAEAIAPYLDHDEPRIRQQAAHALRQMSPDEAFPRLQAGIDDAERSVRVKALASATEVSRNHGVAPPRAMIDVAAERLGDSADRSEERAVIALLGEAARRGDDGARDVLGDRFSQELAGEQRDPARLRALGAHAGAHWQAD